MAGWRRASWGWKRAALRSITAQISDADARVEALEKAIVGWHRNDAASRRLASIPGVGPITASAIAASVPGGLAWLSGLLARKPARLVTVALANKMARIAWAVLCRGESYREAAAMPAA